MASDAAASPGNEAGAGSPSARPTSDAAAAVAAEVVAEEAPNSAVEDDGGSAQQQEQQQRQDTEQSLDPEPRPSSSDPESAESGEVSQDDVASPKAPPLPEGPPPSEAAAAPPQDDGWDFHWDPAHQAYFFHNRFTGATTWENPRLSSGDSAHPPSAEPGAPGTTTADPSFSSPAGAPPPPLPSGPGPAPGSAAGGYNPAIHGDYDPNAWYARGEDADADAGFSQQQQLAFHQQQMGVAGVEGVDYGSTASFNRFTGQFQTLDDGPDRHNDEAKSRRQMNAFFDVDAAANSHDGRSLKAERSGKKPSKAELKQFKEKRKARKEEKRRAWLRD